MEDLHDNPFTVTRAADFTDQQISDYWVDLSNGEGFFNLVKPRSEMPMLILGGKGSGKTHIMRYLSFPLQRLRYKGNLQEGIQKERFVGVYMRCSGLNAARFTGKGQELDLWDAVFAYYTELWLAQMTITICHEIVENLKTLKTVESDITTAIRDLFDDPPTEFPSTLQALGTRLRSLLTELDIKINNSAISRELDVNIRSTSGRLIFGIPQIVTEFLAPLRDCLCVYLIDEFENLNERQQKFINTLIREKQPPSSFKIGARLYGVRTYSTYCADEDNKEGSEYEQLLLESRLRDDETQYSAFVKRLVIKRLQACRMLSGGPPVDERVDKILSDTFETYRTDNLAIHETKFVREKYENKIKPYFDALRKSLDQGLRANVTPGISSERDIDSIIENLTCSDVPLLEKLNCFMFYRSWFSKRKLDVAAATIYQNCQEYLCGRSQGEEYADVLKHFKSDLLAQLRKECAQKQRYIGLATLIDLSWGNPRYLLILLKHIYTWATFKGESPFLHERISASAQIAGVRDAAEWFFRDARIPGREGKQIHDAINRLGTLFRGIRYSHKPSECSLSAFSYDASSVSEESRRLIDLAQDWSLLVSVGSQRDRNSTRVDVKLQFNRMLAPLFDLPVSRRGVLSLSGAEVNAIFDPQHTQEFEECQRLRIDRMTAPYFGKSQRQQDDSQGILLK